MQQELELKLDVNNDQDLGEILSVIRTFVQTLGWTGMKPVHKLRQFTYYDDKEFTLLGRGATLRTVYWRHEDSRYREDERHRHDFKQGAVNSPERQEDSKLIKGGKHPTGYPEQLLHDLEIEGVAKVEPVAKVYMEHYQWSMTFTNFKAEISYDRVFKDEYRRQLLFQEIELELIDGDQDAFMKLSERFEDNLSKKLDVTRAQEQKYARVLRALNRATALAETLNFVIQAHGLEPVKPRKAFRRADGQTPYAIHPCWCALTILHEHKLYSELRQNGALALAYHDILEDTTAELPADTSEEVRKLVDEMTFENYGAELDSWWELSNEAKLLKLYDKVSNLLDGDWMPREKRKVYKVYTLQLADFVAERYGKRLNIVKIARAICE